MSSRRRSRRVRHRAPHARRRHAVGFASVGYRGAHIKVDLVAELLPARARRVLDVLASLVLLLFTVLLAAMLLGRVESAYASNESTFDLRLPVWPWLAAIWLGVLARSSLHRQPPRAHAARLRAEREVHGRGGAGMSTADLVAVSGFAAMFLMMLMRVPIGVAMALTGVGGFAAIAGGPGAQPARDVAGAHGDRLQLQPDPDVHPDGVLATASGMSKELFRAGYAWLGHFRSTALATIGVRGGFAAICGSSVATAATMSNIALPEMRRFGYRDDIATGVIAAGGTLGIPIPPSVVLAIYGFMTEQDVGGCSSPASSRGCWRSPYMATVRLAYGRSLPAAAR